jgi:integrase/recombinase XerC
VGKRRVRGEGTIYKDDTIDRWVGQVWIAGRRRKVSGRTQEEAAKKLGQLLHGDESERHADRRVTVSKILEEWQAKALPGRHLASSTMQTHAWAAALWTGEIGRVKLADLDAPTVEAALARMAAGGLSKGSLIKVRSSLRQSLRWAERRRMVAHNAADAAELPIRVKQGRDRRALTRGELDELLVALGDHPLRPMFLLMARVGLRPGEAAGLCGDALDLDGDPPTVAVVRAVQLQRGRPVLVDDLKTAGARRTLAIPADVAAALRPVVADGGAMLFSTKGSPVWPSTVRAELADACETAGVPSVTPNELRHTAATHLASSGLAPHLIADILGHRSTRMVDAVYRHRPAVIRGAEAVPAPLRRSV